MKEVDVELLLELLSYRPNTPESKMRNVSIRHEIIPEGTNIPVVSSRNFIFMGQRRTVLRFDHDFIIRHLCQDDIGEWMSDSPQEVWQMEEFWRKCEGNVLVGGLGLGVTSSILGNSPRTDSVTTLEKSNNIIKLVNKYLPPGHNMEQGDLFEYLKNLKPGKFDCAALDIWQGTGELTWVSYVVPLLRLCRGKIKQVFCWNEEEMKGQLRRSVPTKARFDNSINFTDSKLTAYFEVFRSVADSLNIPDFKISRSDLGTEAMLKAHIEPIPKRMSDLTEKFLNPRTEEWEELFGDAWDKCYKTRLKHY